MGVGEGGGRGRSMGAWLRFLSLVFMKNATASEGVGRVPSPAYPALLLHCQILFRAIKLITKIKTKNNNHETRPVTGTG